MGCFEDISNPWPHLSWLFLEHSFSSFVSSLHFPFVPSSRTVPVKSPSLDACISPLHLPDWKFPGPTELSSQWVKGMISVPGDIRINRMKAVLAGTQNLPNLKRSFLGFFPPGDLLPRVTVYQHPGSAAPAKSLSCHHHVPPRHPYPKFSFWGRFIIVSFTPFWQMNVSYHAWGFIKSVPSEWSSLELSWSYQRALGHLDCVRGGQYHNKIFWYLNGLQGGSGLHHHSHLG